MWLIAVKWRDAHSHSFPQSIYVTVEYEEAWKTIIVIKAPILYILYMIPIFKLYIFFSIL